MIWPHGARLILSASKMKFLVFAGVVLLCGLVNARINGNIYRKAERVVVAHASTKGDDALSEAECPLGYHVIDCRCNRYEQDGQPCDGVWIIADGTKCQARNSAWGRGVSAVARCVRFTTVESNPGPTYLDRPMARCPPGYKVMDCNLHTKYRHRLGGPAFSIIEGNVCKSSDNCRKCRIQARCIIDAEKFEPGHLPEEVWGKGCVDSAHAGTTTAGINELFETSVRD